MPIEEAVRLEAPEDRIDREEARTAPAESKKKGTVSWKKIKKEPGM